MFGVDKWDKSKEVTYIIDDHRWLHMMRTGNAPINVKLWEEVQLARWF